MKVSVIAAIAIVLLRASAARVAPSDHVRHELRDEHFDNRWTKRDRIEGAVIVPV